VDLARGLRQLAILFHPRSIETPIYRCFATPLRFVKAAMFHSLRMFHSGVV
jgi:hypothetical protein